MTDADRKLRELAAELGRIDAKCDGLRRFNPDHLATTHYQCVRRRADVEARIVFWRNRAGTVGV